MAGPTSVQSKDLGLRSGAGLLFRNTLIQPCKLNGVMPLAYLTDILQRTVSGQTEEIPTACTAAVELARASHKRRHVGTAATAYLATSDVDR